MVVSTRRPFVRGNLREDGTESGQQLRRHLDQFVDEEKIPMVGARFYSHMLPSPQAQTIRNRRIVGRNWAMAGDAAACVDPVTGEGLDYALRSGDLLAQALVEGQPQAYPERLRAAFSGRSGIGGANRTKAFSREFSGRGDHHANGAIAELFAGVSRFDPRCVQRHAGLPDAEATVVESIGNHTG